MNAYRCRFNDSTLRARSLRPTSTSQADLTSTRIKPSLFPPNIGFRIRTGYNFRAIDSLNNVLNAIQTNGSSHRRL